MTTYTEQLVPCPGCRTAPGQPHVDGCDHAACPDCGEQLLMCVHNPDRPALWHGIDQSAWIAAELGWWITHPDDDTRLADFEHVAEARARGYLFWDHQEQRYRKAGYIGVANLAIADLVSALRAGAGAITDRAAVELLAEHRNWLDRSSLRRFVSYSDDPTVTGGPAMAWVNWLEIVKALDNGTLQGSIPEMCILRIAASLGSGVPVSLRDTVNNSLYRPWAPMVVRAIIRATGIVGPVECPPSSSRF